MHGIDHVAPGTVVFSYGRTSTSSHACNCIGCCKECGQCQTTPWHTKTCEQIAALNVERAKIIKDARS